jgi:hypothetical protein
MKHVLIPLAMSAAWLCQAAPIVAPTSSGSSMLYGPAGPRTMGWVFTPTADVVVSALGFFDEGGDGFAESHTVGLFESNTQTLLRSVTLAAGTSESMLSTLGVTGFLAGHSRGVGISSILLSAGQTYVLAGTVSTDIYFLGSSQFNVNPRIGYTADVTITGSDLQYPTTNLGFRGQYGAVLAFDGVPEPSSGVLLGMGCSLLGIWHVVRRGAQVRLRR